MTNEEAIKIVNRKRADFKGYGASDEIIEALDMSIKSLNQIEEIKDVLREWFNDEQPNGNDYMCKIREILDK